MVKCHKCGYERKDTDALAACPHCNVIYTEQPLPKVCCPKCGYERTESAPKLACPTCNVAYVKESLFFRPPAPEVGASPTEINNIFSSVPNRRLRVQRGWRRQANFLTGFSKNAPIKIISLVFLYCLFLYFITHRNSLEVAAKGTTSTEAAPPVETTAPVKSVPAETVTPVETVAPAVEETGTLVLGAVYNCEHTRGEPLQTIYLRFYDNGELLYVGNVGSADVIASWFVSKSEKAFSSNPTAEYATGTYQVNGRSVRGDAKYQRTNGTEFFAFTFSGELDDAGNMTISANGSVSNYSCFSVR